MSVRISLNKVYIRPTEFTKLYGYHFYEYFFQEVAVINRFLPNCGRVFYFTDVDTYIVEIESDLEKFECVVHVTKTGKAIL